MIKIINDVIEEENEKNKIINEQKEKNKKNKNNENPPRGSILLNNKDIKLIAHGRQSFNVNNKLFGHKKIKNNFEETEINNGLVLNEINNFINNNTSNYISDANYACHRKNNSPKK